MADRTGKQSWVEPTVEPLTESGSRADVPDQPVENGVSIPSQATN
jgi:hypothetical protein